MGRYDKTTHTKKYIFIHLKPKIKWDRLDTIRGKLYVIWRDYERLIPIFKYIWTPLDYELDRMKKELFNIKLHKYENKKEKQE